jgi:biotin transport system ATP-binding protein
VITLTDLGYDYPGGGPALEGVSLHLPAGALMVLAGVNGSGKSTLLSLLAGIFTPTAGRLAIGPCTSPKDCHRFRELVSLVVQDSDLQIVGATVSEDLCLGLPPADAAGLARARGMAERFGLAPLWEAPVQTLSGGQKRRLCLAAALRDRPQVLVLDEPFANLDYPGVAMMREIIADNKGRGLTQIIAAHDVEPLADLADSWAVLAAGRLALTGTADEVFPRLRDHGVRPPCAWLLGRDLLSW